MNLASQCLMILPKTNEENFIFYNILIQKICKNLSIDFTKIESKDKLEFSENGLLFESVSAKVISINSISVELLKKINLSNHSEKLFIFVPYALYKKSVKDFKFLNTYEFKQDMTDYIQEYSLLLKDWKKEDERNFLNYCSENQHMFFSDLDKQELSLFSLVVEKNSEGASISSIRKDIYRLKMNFSLKNIRDFYLKIKEEVRLKKFNF